jgi:lipoic acid synthetase
VKKGIPPDVDDAEPCRVAEAVKFLGLKYVVLTSVTRDDLPDGGADQFAKVIGAIREISKGAKVEVLVPDFRGDINLVRKVLWANPEVFAHNIETVSRLYPVARSAASYQRSLALLRNAKRISPKQIVKSGLMAGLGECSNEMIDTITDIAQTGCDILTIGQYLRPSMDNVAVERFVTPDEFDLYKKAGFAAGIREVVSGPFVRSSYRAGNIYDNLKIAG